MLLLAAIGLVTAATATLAVFVPIAADEIGWNMLQARLLLDGGVNIHQIAICVGSFATPPAGFMVPFRLLDAALYADLSEPLRLRVGGILAWIAFVALLLSIARLDSVAEGERGTRAALLLGLLGLGWLPFALIINRPEQVHLAGSAALVLLTMWPSAAAVRAAGSDLARAVTVGLIAAWMFSHGPRAIVLSPLLLAAAFFAVHRLPLRIATVAVIAVMGGLGLRYWQKRFACSESSAAAAQLLSIGGAPDDQITLVQRALNWLGNQLHGEFHLGLFVIQILFGGERRLRWFEPATTNSWLADLANAAIATIVVLACLLAVAFVATRLLTILRTRRVEPRDALLLALAAAGAALLVLQARRLIYETALLMGLLALMLALTLPAWRRRWLWRAALAIVVVAIVSHVELWLRFAPRVPDLIAARGFVERQPQSISPFGRAALAVEIRAAAQLCGIDDASRLAHLVVDEVTYSSFWASAYRPFSAGYLRGVWAPANSDLGAFLTERGSAGVIASCQRLPAGLRESAREHSGFCCHPAFTR